MPSSDKTSLGLNIWSGTDTPKRDDFNEDNRISDYKIVQIEESKANLYPDQNIVLLNGITQGFPTADTCKAVRIGSMVILQVVGMIIPSNFPIDTIMFYLDEIHRPSKNCTIIMISNNNVPIRLALYNNGQVQIKTSGIASGNYHATGCFPI